MAHKKGKKTIREQGTTNSKKQSKKRAPSQKNKKQQEPQSSLGRYMNVNK